MPKDAVKRGTITETDSDSDSGPDDVPAKKTKTSDGSKKQTNKEGEAYFELSSKRRLTVREFKGKLYVDIREYYESKDKGTLMPGKKGIMLSTQDWSAMMDVVDEINAMVKTR